MPHTNTHTLGRRSTWQLPLAVGLGGRWAQSSKPAALALFLTVAATAAQSAALCPSIVVCTHFSCFKQLFASPCECCHSLCLPQTHAHTIYICIYVYVCVGVYTQQSHVPVFRQFFCRCLRLLSALGSYVFIPFTFVCLLRAFPQCALRLNESYGFAAV